MDQICVSSMGDYEKRDDLIPPEMLAGLTAEQRKEALAAAAAAKRAEEKAEQRALERALKRKEEERKREREMRQLKSDSIDGAAKPIKSITAVNTSSDGNNGVKFIPKKKRAQLEKGGDSNGENGATVAFAGGAPAANPNSNQSVKQVSVAKTQTQRAILPTAEPSWSRREKEAIKETYLGKTAEELEQERAEKRQKLKANKKITFRFKWDETDDTFQEDDPLYASIQPRNPLARSAAKARHRTKKDALADMSTASMDSVRNKPLEKMTARDWRIFRENYEIVVKGGRAPPPMRSFRENPLPSSEIASLHPAILDALENVMGFREPTPIQRQAIPIGLQRRDLIGIAETGSGKTIAFGVPLCNYLLSLPEKILNRVAEEGPLAIVMAPTRELALQIDGELSKLLSRQKHIRNCAIIGGQQLQHQAYELRKGVHIVIGTPGRINECLEMAYLVLNQCSFIVMDEADRMIDMGFAPQMESILDAMGGLLKSENEQEAYEQEKQDLFTHDLPRHRVTAMFSATMPMEVERIAKRYLRHPAVISIGDQDSGKNARIVQHVIFLSSPSQKEKALRDILNRSHGRNEKIIVFVNEKKHADQVGRVVERMGHPCVVLHGGKSQEQREENLGLFRRGGVVLVATDVAGRGIDIPNVTHIINYDLPTRSIENYSHRIGRTGRAGKEGLATSFITDEDAGIMAPLKAYLQSTGSKVPDRLANHPAASAGASNNLIF